MKSQGQVVVVGGSRGLGRVVVERYRSLGYVVTNISRQKPTDDLSTFHVSADLEAISSSENVVSEVVRLGGEVRYLIFSQRYRGKGDSWHGEIQVSLTATKILIDGFAKHFCKDGDRAIGVVSSVYAELVGGSQPVSYHVAKAGLNQLVKYNAWVMGRLGIRINAIMPLTYLKAESKDYYLENTNLMDLYKDLVPLGSIGKTDDSVNLLEFLCSKKASFINGQSIYIDGGVSVIWPEELAKSMAAL